MSFRLFYAWQSDTPSKVCRGLIRRSLDEAKKHLEDDLEIQDAVRGEIVVDQDTQDVPGSPPIADTIFDKIRGCNAFIADLTPTHAGPNERAAPNPNILIEYGYALHALGDQRIIAVFNEGYGRPEDLPFDLRHRRWPIRYRVHEDDTQEVRQNERQRLARKLVNAIRSIIRTLAESDSGVASRSGALASNSRAALPGTDQQPAGVSVTTGSTAEQFPWDAVLVHRGSGARIGFREAPTIFLNLRSNGSRPQLDNASRQRIAWESLRPLASHRADGQCIARSRNGAAVFVSSDTEPPVALTASMLARDGSIHGVDRYHLRVNRPEHRAEPYVPTTAVEEVLIDGLANFMSVADHQLKLELPLDVAVGLEGVDGFKLAVDRSRLSEEFIGPILVERIDHRFSIDTYASDPFDLLLPFFRKVYDEAGHDRPDTRTVEMNQR